MLEESIQPNNNITVSVIIPIYNQGEALSRCLDSIMEQSFSDYEVILMDDGSTDDTLNVCRAYEKADGRFRSFHQENAGPSAARNHALDLASGKYVVFVDSDDYVAPDYLRQLVSLADDNEGSLAMCGSIFHFPEGKDEKRLYSEREEISEEELLDIGRVYKNHFLNMMCNKIFLRSEIEARNIRFDSEISLGEDLLFILDYLRGAKGFVMINRPLYYYDIDYSGLNYRYRRDRFEINERLFSRIFSFLDEERLLESNRACFIASYIKEQLRALRSFFFREREISFFKKRSLMRQKMESMLFQECSRKLDSRRRLTKLLFRMIQGRRPLLSVMVFTLSDHTA